MSVELAVDGGQTNLRMGLVQDGVLQEITNASGFAYSAEVDLTENIANAVMDAYAAFGSPSSVRRICLGLTAAPVQPEGRRRLATSIEERLGGAEVWLGPDMVTSHAGALNGRAGVVITAGTGVVCLGIGTNGSAHQADGHGYLLGDSGSGFAVGRAALRAVMDARDGRGPATALVDAAENAFGDLGSVSQRIYNSAAPVRLVAGCTSWVAAVARTGDPVARAVWTNAVDQLVGTTSAVVQRTFPEAGAGEVPVSYAGGLFTIDDLIRGPFVKLMTERCPTARIISPLGGALDGALWLLAHGLGPYAPLMLTTGSEVSA